MHYGPLTNTSRSLGAHQSCRKSRIVSWIDACIRGWGNGTLGCRITSHTRSSVCCVVPTLPLFFLGVTLCVFDRGSAYSLMRPGQSFRHPQTPFFYLFISLARHRHALRARLDAAALVAGRQKGRKKPKARARIQNAPIRCSGGGKEIIHSLSVINLRMNSAHERRGGFTLELDRSRTCVGSAFSSSPSVCQCCRERMYSIPGSVPLPRLCEYVPYFQRTCGEHTDPTCSPARRLRRGLL